MRHASLFSGMGGFDLAAERMGWVNVFTVENNPFCQTILRHYWPDTTHYEDIRQTDFTPHYGQIDLLTGGFPCQPFSQAGKRKGINDKRYLWPEMLRAIREIRPTWVLGENVAGIATMVLQPSVAHLEGGTNAEGETIHRTMEAEAVIHRICEDFEALGYSVQPVVIPACAVEAPHRRDRVWFLAYTHRSAARSSRTGRPPQGNGSQNHDEPNGRQATPQQYTRLCHVSFASAYPHYPGTKQPLYPYPQRETAEQRWQEQLQPEPGQNGDYEATTRPHSERLEGHARKEVQKTKGRKGENKLRIAARHCPQICDESLNPKWRYTYPAPRQDYRFRPDWQTQSPVCGGDDGFPAPVDGITIPRLRNESIKGYGNAVVVPLVVEIFRGIEGVER
ncbi:DNA (cytosine-5-)-methyltransferase [Microscilla marina]|uniref:Cytosine-specific methyltransferase n=1 Tax=Microscilla marina ATCC 23134 TaxID=313606 RepID=A1ZIH7_MICM2|nr:DNA (cytosine-5-)-methyltransferase [Microscilla marina]EAY29845.1 site-specific DNA-methyltransferase [Microscilla marina ATCC 23134]